jgi:hypothetical protein
MANQQRATGLRVRSAFWPNPLQQVWELRSGSATVRGQELDLIGIIAACPANGVPAAEREGITQQSFDRQDLGWIWAACVLGVGLCRAELVALAASVLKERGWWSKQDEAHAADWPGLVLLRGPHWCTPALWAFFEEWAPEQRGPGIVPLCVRDAARKLLHLIERINEAEEHLRYSLKLLDELLTPPGRVSVADWRAKGDWIAKGEWVGRKFEEVVA